MKKLIKSSSKNTHTFMSSKVSKNNVKIEQQNLFHKIELKQTLDQPIHRKKKLSLVNIIKFILSNEYRPIIFFAFKFTHSIK
jgi:hypothetical protein